jgi:hypothetical protein
MHKKKDDNMKICINHPDKEALSICRVCGKDFCESCLDEGKEYYYCKNPECQELLNKELPAYKVPENVICSECDSELELSENERIVAKIHCPECESIIDYTLSPPKILKKENYTELLSSLNQGDIGLIKSILDNAEIDYMVFGENFLSVDPLIQPAKIYIHEDQIERAKQLLKDIDLNIFGLSKSQSE